MIQALGLGRANTLFHVVNLNTEHWRNVVEPISANEYEETYAHIKRANILHRDNPHYLITLGLVREWGALSPFASEEQGVEYLLAAKKHYLAATLRRPTWPVTWATLAIVKWRLGELDEEMIFYLNSAQKYGPNRLEVAQAWVDIGFYVYYAKSPLSPKVVKKLREYFKLMAKGDGHGFRQALIDIVARHGVETLACNWVQNFTFDTGGLERQWCKN